MWIWIAFSKLILNIFLRSKNRQSLQPMYQISQGIFKDVKIKQYIYFTDQPETLNTILDEIPYFYFKIKKIIGIILAMTIHLVLQLARAIHLQQHE